MAGLVSVEEVDQVPEITQPDLETRRDADVWPNPSISNGVSGQLLNSSLEASVTAVEQPRESNNRRPSTASVVAERLLVSWRQLVAMLLALVIGLGCCLALHGYYSSLDGKLVGNSDDQQLVLRIGTTLAFFAQVSLVYSIRKAFVQWLWRELKEGGVSSKGIDAAFAATSDPLSFLNTEMLRGVKVASALAFVSWLVPISSLIAPATLNINTVIRNATQVMDIPALDISQASLYQGYSYAVNLTMAVAAATTGEILTLPQPATNASYVQSFFGPYIQCDDSADEVRTGINGMIERARSALDPSVERITLNYFAAVPALSNTPNISSAATQVANLTSFDSTLSVSNQLWIYVLRYAASNNFSQPLVPHYLTCELYNATCTTRFSWENGHQNLEVVNRTLLSPVPYPSSASVQAASEEAMAFSSVMWAISNQLTGSIAFYKDLNTTDDATNETFASKIYSDINSNIAQTVLLGSSDLNSHFLENHMLGHGSNTITPFSDQRLLDMSYAKNRTLDVLIAELSSNSTLSLITDPLLAPIVPISVDTTSSANIYAYQSRNVVSAYTIAGIVALAANALGLYAFYSSGMSHDLSFSSIVSSTQAVHFSRLRAHPAPVSPGC